MKRIGYRIYFGNRNYAFTKIFFHETEQEMTDWAINYVKSIKSSEEFKNSETTVVAEVDITDEFVTGEKS